MKIENLIRPSLKALIPYSTARSEYRGEHELFLDANENPYNNGVNRYPDPLQIKLKKAISDLHNVQQNQLIIGNGSDEILDLLFRAFCNPTIDNCIILPPTYGMYKVLAGLNDVECLECPLNCDFSVNLDRLLAAITSKTKLIFICSPNNPTGTVFSIESLIEILEVFEGILVVDEAYIDFSSYPSALGLIERYPHLFVVQTLSKAYAGAGLRIGIGFGNTKVVNILNGIKAPYNINSLSHERAILLLQDQGIYKKNLSYILEEKEWLYHALSRFYFVETIFPSQANFFLVRVDDAALTYQFLLKNGIIVRNRSHEVGCENCIRITIGTAEQNRQLIAVLNKFNPQNK